MKVRLINNRRVTGHSGDFNIHAMAEVIVGFDGGDCDTMYIHDLEVFVTKLNAWKPLSNAFKDKDVIPDNYNRYFAEPGTEEDRKRGYFD